MSMRIRISGIVQGVGFRPAVYRTAVSEGLNGKVWNDGSDVIIDIDDRCDPSEFMEILKRNVLSLATVECVSFENVPYAGDDGFSIVQSKNGSGGVSIPADSAVCGICLRDMKEGRRKGYEFTSCTECGARFTLLRGMPYDRSKTAMNGFGMCPRCESEYNDPGNRRFHHQTICCPECGPRYRLLDNLKDEISGDPAESFAKMLNDGRIGVIKSWGGMHICALPRITKKLRKWYGREYKPFAVMARDIESVYEYAEPNDLETKHLTSKHRPIVLVKKIHSDVTEMLSPGLDNIGIFLPYTGMQHELFRHTAENAIVTTSANLPGEPMMIDDNDVFELNADMYLLHDQPIINRADDSVLRVNCGRTSFIRRSRGHVPSFIDVSGKGCAIGLGAQENLTASVAFEGRIHTTQHIGDGGSLGVPEYLEHAAMSLKDMLGCAPDIIVTDMHPGYSNRSVGKRMAEMYNCGSMEVQHHWAHAASLLIDNGEEECVALSLDGTGYGTDGNAWGGEVLYSTMSKFERLAHLQYIPLLGSEKALHDLRRLKFAINEMNGTASPFFTDNETDVLKKMMRTSIKTSSFGRFLDAVAFTFGICEKRTYDGEPAMRTEPLLSRGKMIEGFDTRIIGKEIMTADLFSRVERTQDKNDAAYSIVRSVIGTMTEVACDHAASLDMERIGLTGGVSYNAEICRMVIEEAASHGFGVMMHNRIPNGDPGISVGQAAIAIGRSS